MTPTRQPTVAGTAFAVRDPWPWPAFASLVRDGEELGYRAVFLPEIAGRDAFAALTGLASETSSLLLGTGIVPITSRRPAASAMGAATVHERSGGRAILGLGTGAPRPGALDELRSQVDEIRALLDAAVRGSHDGAALRLDRRVPVWIAALGPRALQLAGRVADGVLLNWCSPERVSEATATIAESATAAGRDPAAITVAAYVRATVADPEDEERDAARRALALAASEYASYPAYRYQFGAMGLDEAAEAAATARSAGRAPALDAVAPLIDAVCVWGAPSDARARLAGYREAGADLPVVYPVPFGHDPVGSVRRTLAALGPGP